VEKGSWVKCEVAWGVGGNAWQCRAGRAWGGAFRVCAIGARMKGGGWKGGSLNREWGGEEKKWRRDSNHKKEWGGAQQKEVLCRVGHTRRDYTTTRPSTKKKKKKKK